MWSERDDTPSTGWAGAWMPLEDLEAWWEKEKGWHAGAIGWLIYEEIGTVIINDFAIAKVEVEIK